MLGRGELRQLELQKQALLIQSQANRLALLQELETLRSAGTWLGAAARASRGGSPLLLLVAPLAGFLVAKGVRRSSLWLTRLAKTAGWAVPLYRLWKTFAARRNEAAESGS